MINSSLIPPNTCAYSSFPDKAAHNCHTSPAIFSFCKCRLNATIRLSDVTASDKSASRLKTHELRITCPQILFGKSGQIHGTKPRSIHNIGVFRNWYNLRMACRMFPRSILSLIPPVCICTASCRSLISEDFLLRTVLPLPSSFPATQI